MNWCSIKHKWEYKKEDIIYKRIDTGYFSFPLKTEVPISTEVRICKRCHKKERMGIRGYWIEWDLTKEEEREIRLKELGI
jgi:hypothetical protein